MEPILQLMLLTSVAGLAMPAGAGLATLDRIRPGWLENELRHTIIAFGGGVLLAAVSLVLVPEGSAALAPGWVAVAFLAGGGAFLALDRALAAHRTPAAQLVAMLADFVPEALALGAGCATGKPTTLLLAILITVQNVPEGFNAYRERKSAGGRGRHTILAFFLLAPLGPLSGLAGFFWLSAAPNAVAAVMLFAAGGILYLTFQDIAPQARLERRFAPPMGAVAGFLLGLIGHMLIAAA